LRLCRRPFASPQAGGSRTHASTRPGMEMPQNRPSARTPKMHTQTLTSRASLPHVMFAPSCTPMGPGVQSNQLLVIVVRLNSFVKPGRLSCVWPTVCKLKPGAIWKRSAAAGSFPLIRIRPRLR